MIGPISRLSFSVIGASLLPAVAAFLIYGPSLKSDFVYDARAEILQEGFLTSLSNLPAVLSGKVLGMKLILGSRPGQLLYLMSIAAVCGKAPFGYHLCSNLLHATNVALLFILLLRLVKTEPTGPTRTGLLKVQAAAGAVTLVFALHPLTVESVAEVSYSSNLLVTFFALLALLAATAFRPENIRVAAITGAPGALCAFAAVTCKESGLAVPFLLITYWFLFRRQEAKGPWLLFLGATTIVTALFLAARFAFAPPGAQPPGYPGGSFSGALSIQPRLWVFMMGKLIWPTQLSADYTLEDLGGLSASRALLVLVMVAGLQGWLAVKSRLGALGVAIYWLGLATVSNFIPLNHPTADRYYYLPLVGAAMQLSALLLMTLQSRQGFWLALTPCLIALLPLSFLTLTREAVFSNDLSLWSDTLRASPFSSAACYGLGYALANEGRPDEAILEFQKALEIDPNNFKARFNLAYLLVKKGRLDEATAQYQLVLKIAPNYFEAHNNLGLALCQKGELDEAITQFQKALEINPDYADGHANLGLALFKKGQMDEALAQFQDAVQLKPNDPEAQDNLAKMKAVAAKRAPGK
jgi:tetratricopeptide (TPR) repeat protein